MAETNVATSNISDDMRAAIGREYRRKTSFPVSESDIRRWAIAVYWPDPPPARYWDASAAEQGPCGGIVAPHEFNPFAWMDTGGPAPAAPEQAVHDPDATEKALGIAGPGLKFQLNGGLEVGYGVPIRPGDVITSSTCVADYHEREGRLGLMLFTVMEDVWTNQAGAEVKRQRITLIRY